MGLERKFKFIIMKKDVVSAKAANWSFGSGVAQPKSGPYLNWIKNLNPNLIHFRSG